MKQGFAVHVRRLNRFLTRPFVPIAHAGWRRPSKVGKLGALVDGSVQVSSVPPTPPLAGDKPQRYISPAALGCRSSGDGGWCRRPRPESIPDRSPGHASLPIAHADCHQNTRVQQWGPLVGGSARVPMSPPSPLLDSGFRRNDDLDGRNDGARRGHLDPQASLEPSICAPQMAQGDAGDVPCLNRFLLPTQFRHYVVGTQRGPVGAGQRSIQPKPWRPGEIGRRRSDSCNTSSDSTQRRCVRRDETRY